MLQVPVEHKTIIMLLIPATMQRVQASRAAGSQAPLCLTSSLAHHHFHKLVVVHVQSKEGGESR
jgi:hypothetical protein